MRQIFTLIGIFLLTGFAASAQTAKISGSIKDEGGKSLPAATVNLLRAKDSGLVKVAISDKSGQYEFINIKDGNYLLSVTSVGYGKSFSNSFEVSGSDVTMSSLALQQNSKDMNSVTVTAKKTFC
jgi:iron complex outermembrane receptor protein